MKKMILVLTLSVMAALNVAASTANYEVVPLPREINMQKGAPFMLTNLTTIAVAHDDADGQMMRNAEFLIQYVAEATGLKLRTTADKRHAGIVLDIDSKRVANAEGYTMTVSPKRITIAGGSPAGVFYAIQTLRKSLPVATAEEKVNAGHSVELPTVVIADEPRFGYRGMLLDCGRYFYPLSFVKRFIDLMAMHNMNTFHWHLSEDQGWRIEIKKYPRLTEIGSVRKETIIGHNSPIYDGRPHGGFYSQDEAREIVEYARQRCITVIPEIDMPGHMLSALASYPSLGCTGGPYEVSRRWGVFPDVICLGNEEVYTFCQDVLTEIMDVFPSAYIHIGGDEAPNVRWAACPKCQQLMQREQLTPKTVQGYFTNRIEQFVNSHGRRIIGWDEILDGKINNSATIQSWRGAETGQRAAEAGHDVIMSPTSHCYFDYQQTENTRNEPSLCGGLITVEKVYGFNPVAGLSESAVSHILGVQGNIWGEFIPYTNLVEYQALPRMGALAEVQWTNGMGKDFNTFLPRLTRLTTLYDLYHYNYARHLWK